MKIHHTFSLKSRNKCTEIFIRGIQKPFLSNNSSIRQSTFFIFANVPHFVITNNFSIWLFLLEGIFRPLVWKKPSWNNLDSVSIKYSSYFLDRWNELKHFFVEHLLLIKKTITRLLWVLFELFLFIFFVVFCFSSPSLLCWFHIDKSSVHTSSFPVSRIC